MLTLGFVCLALICCVNITFGDIEPPPGLSSGDTFHWVFITSTGRNALSSNIDDYNQFVQAAANASSLPVTGVQGIIHLGQANWCAIATTKTVDARDNIGDPSSPIFLLDGNLIASDEADLWDGSINHIINITELMTLYEGHPWVWTGSNSQGVAGVVNYPLRYCELGGSWYEPIMTGYWTSTGGSWVSAQCMWAAFGSGGPSGRYLWPLYAISEELTVSFSPPVANAGPDQTVEQDSYTGASVTLDGSASYDPDGDPLTYSWTWPGGSTSGVGPIIVLSPGTTTITLVVNDGALDSEPDTVDITVEDTTPPDVEVIFPIGGEALQDIVSLTAVADDWSGISDVYFYIREDDGSSGIPISTAYENIPATFASGQWEYSFDTTELPDGYYLVFAKAVDSSDNEGWSDIVPFSIRNWAVLELLPSSKSNKAGRTMPVKFSLRIAEAIDPAIPFVHNAQLEIKIFDASNLTTVLQTSVYGDTSKDYRINDMEEL